jgi:hypothetical protein
MMIVCEENLVLIYVGLNPAGLYCTAGSPTNPGLGRALHPKVVEIGPDDAKETPFGFHLVLNLSLA